VAHAIKLGVVLYALWILLSGHFDPLLLGLGLLSTVFVVLIALRMDVVDHEGQPFHLRSTALLGYWAWLGWEVIKSNLDVTRRILDPRMPIEPTLTRLKATQGTDLGRVIYANSITLTPGTVALNVEDDAIEVHALSREAAQALEAGEMDRRVTALEID